MSDIDLPSVRDCYVPILHAVRQLGGEGTNEKINAYVMRELNLTRDQLAIVYESSGKSAAEHRIALARSHLKKDGYLTNPRKKYWVLTQLGRDTKEINPREINRSQHSKRSSEKPDATAITPSANLRIDKANKTMATKKDLPPAGELLIPAMQALREMGGTARRRDIRARVKELAQLSDEQTQLIYANGRATVYGDIINRVWKILLANGLISVPQTGTYQLTDAGWAIEMDALAKLAQSSARRRATPSTRAPENTNLPTMTLDQLLAESSDWRAQLHDRLYSLSDSQLTTFFHLIFDDYGKGTIEIMQSDHKGVIDGLFTIQGIFDMRYCIRFAFGERLLGSNDIADLRSYANASGAVSAFYLTTGKFTEAALQEAARNLNPKVQLIDGEQLASMMKQEGWGVRSERVIVERTVIDENFFTELGL
ncbi:MAG: hypothetical protein F4Y70_11140 [Chloroflexi bacterium]|nr:hypothetical protein [Chloroflexota bacterium]MXX83999.1 hypothetical protein [Chloroflexota bacterium]